MFLKKTGRTKIKQFHYSVLDNVIFPGFLNFSFHWQKSLFQGLKFRTKKYNWTEMGKNPLTDRKCQTILCTSWRHRRTSCWSGRGRSWCSRYRRSTRQSINQWVGGVVLDNQSINGRGSSSRQSINQWVGGVVPDNQSINGSGE